MNSAHPVDLPLVLHDRLDRPDLVGEEGFRPNKVDIRQELVRAQDVRHPRTDLRRKIRQYPDNLPALLRLQLPDAVVRLHHGLRLDKNRLPAGGFVVHDTLYLPLERRSDGNHQTPVAHGRGDILIHHTLRLRRAENGLQVTRDAAHRRRYLPADPRQGRRGIILDMPELVQYTVYTLNQRGEYLDVAGQLRQRRIAHRSLLVGSEKAHDIVDGPQGTLKVEQLPLVQPRPFRTNPLQGGTHVEEIIDRELLVAPNEAQKLVRPLQPRKHLVDPRGKTHIPHPLLTKGA